MEKFRRVNTPDEIKANGKTNIDGPTHEIVVTPAASEEASQNPTNLSDAIPKLSTSASSDTLVEKSDAQELEKAPTEGKEAPISNTAPSDNSQKGTPDAESEKDDPKKRQGWLAKAPFSHGVRGSSREMLREFTFWSDLTLKEKIAYRKEFLKEYLSETKKCFPYVRKLFMMIYRISPWRAAVILVLNVINSLLPALTLQTRGSFILMLQQGLEKGGLNFRELVKLLIKQLAVTALDKINEDILYNPSSYTIDIRIKMTRFLNARLRKDLDVGLFQGFLELDISEMKDEDITVYFNEARRVVKEDGIRMFTYQLGIFRDCTSILARIATLASLTNRKSWPILSLTASLPLLDHLLQMIPWEGSERRHYYSCEATDQERHLETARTYISRVARDVNARPEVLIFGAKKWLVQRYSELSELLVKTNEEGRLIYNRTEAPFIHKHLFPMLHSGARALLYLVVAFQPDYFGMPISQLSFLESSVEGVFSSITCLQKTLSYHLVKDMFKVRNLFECIDIKSKVSLPEHPATYKSHPYGMKIQVKDLTFGYGKDTPPVLKDVNFTIEPGQIVSIVGYNGSGKSTLIRLLTLLEKPASGKIYINDIDVTEYEPQILRTNMSVLFQEFQKYQGISASDNIAIGNSNVDEFEAIKTASTQSGAHDYIRTFNSFYATRLCKKHEVSSYNDWIPPPQHTFKFNDLSREIPFMIKMLGDRLHCEAKARGKPLSWDKKPKKEGINIEIPEHKSDNIYEYVEARALSGGQWQRVALARSFMKIKEADLLILDEPSSALDPQAEYEVFKSLMELRKNRTTIFISHRFHTVRAATKIMLFDEGKLIEMGTHDELVQKEGGKYSHLFKLQSEGYAEFNSEKQREKGAES